MSGVMYTNVLLYVLFFSYLKPKNPPYVVRGPVEVSFCKSHFLAMLAAQGCAASDPPTTVVFSYHPGLRPGKYLHLTHLFSWDSLCE